jgi:hypothetical protein
MIAPSLAFAFGALTGRSAHFCGSDEGSEIATTTLRSFPARTLADRNAFLLFTALVWVGVLSGFAATGQTPDFLAVQFTDILAFTGLTAAGLLMRRIPLAHKRLMLLGLIYISDAGFSRFLNGAMAAPLGNGAWGEVAGLYLGSDLLMLGFGVYDLSTRGRLHPAYIAGVVWTIALQFTALVLLGNPTWKALSLHLIGH